MLPLRAKNRLRRLRSVRDCGHSGVAISVTARPKRPLKVETDLFGVQRNEIATPACVLVRNDSVSLT